MKRLKAMERDNQLKINRFGFIKLLSNTKFIAGKIQAHKDGFGFLIRDDGQNDIFISIWEMKKVMHGDYVLVQLIKKNKRGRLEGHIIEITKHVNQYLICYIINTDTSLIAMPEDIRFRKKNILIQSISLNNKYIVGQIVNVKLIKFPTQYSDAIGNIIECFGNINTPGIEIKIAIHKYDLPYKFHPDVIKQADSLPNKVLHKDLEKRLDLRNLPFITIDNEEAHDFDDAVYCEPTKIGCTSSNTSNFRVLVAIADVSYYVKSGDALDISAMERGTSIYFPNQVIPMLPEKISNWLCSLNPNVDRCVLVCELIINTYGIVKTYQFYPAIIRSIARLTYSNATSILSNFYKKTKTISFNNNTIVSCLENLQKTYNALFTARKKRGAINIDITETYFVCNGQGKINSIISRERNTAHRIIEELMLTANVCAADFLEQYKHPVLFRIHRRPNNEKLNKLRVLLQKMNLNLGGNDIPHASHFSALINEIKSRPDSIILQTIVLRSMQQAIYSPDNIGHFGLAYNAYTHFTSPIRRYSDLLTHRAIYAVLDGIQYIPTLSLKMEANNTNSMLNRKRKIFRKKSNIQQNKQQLKIWSLLGTHCSANERRADEASRDVDNWLKCRFMQKKIGEEYNGYIININSLGLYVQIDLLLIEGLVCISELNNDHFKYNKTYNELRGEKTGICYHLTDRVRVQVYQVDLTTQKIFFRLLSNISTNLVNNNFLQSSSNKKINLCKISIGKKNKL